MATTARCCTAIPLPPRHLDSKRVDDERTELDTQGFSLLLNYDGDRFMPLQPNRSGSFGLSDCDVKRMVSWA